MIAQHWDLLSETADAMVQATSFDIQRGLLPGGVSGFDPEPTAAFVVAGSVSQGAAGSSWTVGLYDGIEEEPFAQVTFLPSDSATMLKEASFAWPATDTPLAWIEAAPVGALAGTFSIRKAYVAIRQEGTILATTARVPLASKQLAITASSFQDVADPLYYRHVTSDFHLVRGTSLSMRLRATARVSSGAIEVRLASSSGAAVTVHFEQLVTTNSQGTNPVPSQSLDSALPAGLAKSDDTYRVQVAAVGTAARGDLLSVDLLLSHRTEDPKGLAETVAFYPAVSAPQDMAVAGQDLGFPFQAPERAVREETRTWVRTVKAPIGSGTADVILRDRTAGADRTSAASSPGATYLYRESPAADSPAGNILDSRTALGTMTTGRVSGSALRIRLVLGDIWNPVISGIRRSNPAFSPNADGNKDSTVLTADIADESPLRGWKLEVRTVRRVVRSWSGVTGSVSEPWTGRDSEQAAVADGNYPVLLLAVDDWGNMTLSRTSVTVDTLGPVLAVAVPDDGSNTLFRSQPVIAVAQDSYRGAGSPPGPGVDPAFLEVRVQDVAHLEAEQRPSATLEGRLIRSQAVDLTAGVEYQATVKATDLAGNGSTATSRFLVMESATTTPANQISTSIQPMAPSEVRPGGTIEATDTYVWDDVPVSIGAFDVTLSATGHAGDGLVFIDVPVSEAQVTYTMAGIPGLPLRPVEDSARVRVPFGTDDSGVVTVAVPGQAVSGGTLTAAVPKGVDQGSVRLALDADAGTAGLPVCADPVAASDKCTPDPLPGFRWQANGIVVFSEDPELRGPTGPAAGPPCTAGSSELSPEEASSSPHSIGLGYLPPGAVETGAPSGAACGHETVALSRQFIVYPGGALVGVIREIGRSVVRFDSSADRITTSSMNGKAAVIIAPSGADGLGNSMVIIRESYGITRVGGLDLPLEQLLQVAEGVS